MSQSLEQIINVKTVMNNIFEEICDSKNVESMLGNMYKKLAAYKKDFQKGISSYCYLSTDCLIEVLLVVFYYSVKQNLICN